ncbi:PAAR domain-containing protein [Cupriavidus sp. NPDC089707]|uniref:PAAR domain-containing protein n=1 Tax=Cupriavidus sp. NPDC089707 TaxID=3363963 RepID=UPI0038035E78
MVTRTYLIKGDKADNGAVIVGGSPDSTYHGIPVARDGDPVYCPVCKRQGIIACTGPRWPYSDNGKEMALSGDICVCGCAKPPVFFASRPYTMTMTAEDVAEHCASYSTSYIGDTNSQVNDEVIEEYFEIFDGVTGQPAEGYLYDLYANGSRIQHQSRFSNGRTVDMKGEGNLRLVMWLDKDGENRP